MNLKPSHRWFFSAVFSILYQAPWALETASLKRSLSTNLFCYPLCFIQRHPLVNRLLIDNILTIKNPLVLRQCDNLSKKPLHLACQGPFPRSVHLFNVVSYLDLTQDPKKAPDEVQQRFHFLSRIFWCRIWQGSRSRLLRSCAQAPRTKSLIQSNCHWYQDSTSPLTRKLLSLLSSQWL